MRKGKALRIIRVIEEHNSKGNNGVIKGKITNLLESFKMNILSTLSNSLDQFKEAKNKEEVGKFLSIYCPKCAKRHGQNECLLNKIRICNIYQDPHETNDFLALPQIKTIYQLEFSEYEDINIVN